MTRPLRGGDLASLRRPASARPLLASASTLPRWAVLVLACSAHGGVLAQTQAKSQDEALDKIVVTGTRVATTALKSASPVQVFDATRLQATGEADLRTALAAVAPSYISVFSNGGALAKNTRGSSLRGLSGNHVLVLVNGKRRHGSSLVNNSGGATLGSSAADLAHIPVSAVERVEVLTDGASALYGSDAIAGVINIILKSDASGGSAELLYGEYNHSVSKVNGVGDAGRTIGANADLGIELGQAGGFAHVAVSGLHTGNSHVVGAWKQPTRAIWQLYGAPNDPREATADRRVHSNIETVPLQELGNLSVNLQLPLAGATKLYSFVTYSRRTSEAKGSYRSETNGTANVYTTPGGYGPALETKEEDAQVNLGIKGDDLAGWSWDLGLSAGRHRSDIWVNNTINASFGTLVPLSNLYVGNLTFDEAIGTLGISRAFRTGAFGEPLRVSAGAELRHNALKLGQGEYYSYAGGGYVFPADYPAVNLRGTLAGAGSAFLTGFAPQFEFDRQRRNAAVYLDLSQRFTPAWEAAAALRYERYSDFGSALSGKLSSRFEVSPALALRGTFSNGFRAPSLHEQYYSSATVQPTNDPITNTSYISYNYDTLPQAAPAAIAFGARPLKAEKSRNLSLGLVATPSRKLSASFDVYAIDIADRIYLTGAFNGFNNPAAQSILRAAGLTTQQSVRYFSNFGDTRTVGAEVKADYAAEYGAWGRVDWGFSYAWNRQKVRRIHEPAVLKGTGLSLLGRDRIVLLEEALPQHIVKGTAVWRRGPWRFDLTETWYAKTRTVNNVLNPDQDSVSSAAFITDASLGYAITKQARFTIGARNLFNKRANNQPDSLASTLNYENPYPNQNTPYGFGGAFYYARLNLDW